MNTQKHSTWSRRKFLRGLTIAGSAGLLGLRAEPATVEPPPETSTIRLPIADGEQTLCFSPSFIAEHSSCAWKA